MALSKADKKRLETVHEESKKGPDTFAYMNPKEMKKLSEAGFVVFNESQKADNGIDIAFRSTDAGAQALGDPNMQPVDRPRTNLPPAQFMLEDVMPIPEKVRRGRLEATYPFEKLAVGQPFFVPVSAERPDPKKSMSSTVSAANRRYAKNENDKRKFEIFDAEVNGVKGIRVFRVA